MTLSHSLWRRDSPRFPGIPEYQEILPQVQRIVSAVLDPSDPTRYLPLAVTYEQVEVGMIRTQLYPDSGWVENRYRVDGNEIYWNTIGPEWWKWELISGEDLPEWFPAFQAKAQQRKDQRDAAIAKDMQEAEQRARADCSEPGTLPKMERDPAAPNSRSATERSASLRAFP